MGRAVTDAKGHMVHVGVWNDDDDTSVWNGDDDAGVWNADNTECTWAEPRWFGVWVEPDEDGCEWALCGIERGSWQSGSEVLIAEFQDTSWVSAKATFQMLIAWAREGAEFGD